MNRRPDDASAMLIDALGARPAAPRAAPPGAASRLLPEVYDQLRSLAASYLGRQGPDHTLQPTALVHEAYLKLVGHDRDEWNGRAHFLAVAARAMRQILVDHARAKQALKRNGNGVCRSVVENDVLRAPREVDLVPLDDALRRLARLDERKSRVVELRFFAGLTIEETAHVLEVSPTTVEGDWRFARAWLRDQLALETTP